MILVDSAEPEDIIRLLQQSVEVTVMPLNQSSKADYYFGGDESKSIQFCRVQAGELLANIDSQEDELRRYYDNADVNNLVIEGLITDTPISKRDKSLESVSVRRGAKPTTLYSYRVAPNGYIFSEHAHDERAEKLYAWLYRLQENGVNVFSTHNFIGTAKLLAAVYHNTQKPVDSHQTLNRYYIPRITLGEKEKCPKCNGVRHSGGESVYTGWEVCPICKGTGEGGKRVTIRKQNPLIRGLMALSIVYGIDIGEKRATALYKFGYKTLFDLAFASVGELTKVEGIGRVTAEKLLQAIGVQSE